MLGVNAPGYKAPPEMSPDEVAAKVRSGGQRFFAFRHVEDIRDIMEKYGDADKQIAILEIGWTTDPIHPEYAWHAVTEQQQADYLVRAYQYAYEHWSPWIGLMSMLTLADPDLDRKRRTILVGYLVSRLAGEPTAARVRRAAGYAQATTLKGSHEHRSEGRHSMVNAQACPGRGRDATV